MVMQCHRHWVREGEKTRIVSVLKNHVCTEKQQDVARLSHTYLPEVYKYVSLQTAFLLLSLEIRLIMLISKPAHPRASWYYCDSKQTVVTLLF